MISHKNRVFIIVSVALLACLSLLFINPIPQDIAYHNFSDKRAVLALHNVWNVLSNLPFIIVGLVGLARYSGLMVSASRAGYLVLSVGVILVGFGSSYYHLNPTNETLLWDRLPMTVAFMAFFSLLVGERLINAY